MDHTLLGDYIVLDCISKSIHIASSRGEKFSQTKEETLDSGLTLDG